MYKIFFNKDGLLNNAIPFDPSRFSDERVSHSRLDNSTGILQGEVLGWCKFAYKKAPTQEREVGAGGIGAGSG